MPNYDVITPQQQTGVRFYDKSLWKEAKTQRTMTAEAILLLILTPLISAAAGLTGVFLGGWISARNERGKRRSDFVGRQLSEFYGPIVSLRAEIKARSELRLRIQNAGDSEWRRLSSGATTPEAGQQLQQTRWPAFSAIIEDDNKTFREDLMPAYRRIVTTFRDMMWLAEPETRPYFVTLVEFVDVWERYLREAIPGEVVKAMGHSEANLHPFYDHVEKVHDRLRAELSSRP